jgi:hypothetical protein
MFGAPQVGGAAERAAQQNCTALSGLVPLHPEFPRVPLRDLWLLPRQSRGIFQRIIPTDSHGSFDGCE